jgi:hypothetical protein
MLKAAETAKMAGHTHFAMMGSDNQSSTLTHVSGGRFFATASTTVKPGTDTLIKVLTLPAGSVAPAGTFNADEIIAIIGSRVERPDDHERKPKRPS